MSDYDLLLHHCNLLLIALRVLPREDPAYAELKRDYDDTRRKLADTLAS